MFRIFAVSILTVVATVGCIRGSLFSGSLGSVSIDVTAPESVQEGSVAKVTVKPSTRVVGTVSYKVNRTDENNGVVELSSGELQIRDSGEKQISISPEDDSDFHEYTISVTLTPSPGLSLSKSSFTYSVIDNDGDSVSGFSPSVNTNFSSFESPIDGNPTISSTVTLSVTTNVATPLHTALSAATPGTRIVVPDGTYNNQSLNFSSGNCPNGESNRPIIVQAATPGGVILTGASSVRLCGSYIVLQGFVFSGTTTTTSPIKVGDAFSGIYRYCNNCAIRNIFMDGYSLSNPDSTSTWISFPSDTTSGIVSSVNTEISDSKFVNKSNLGTIIYMSAPTTTGGGGHRIYRNYFSRPAPAGATTNGLEVIRIGDSTSSSNSGNVIVEHNVFERADGDAETVSLKSNNNIVRYNSFIETKGTLSIRIGNSNILEGNYFFGRSTSGTGGIRMNGAENLAIGNHFQDLIHSGTLNNTYVMGTGLLNGDGATCSVAAYCRVRNGAVSYNVYLGNSSNLVFGAAYNAGRTENPTQVLIAGNLIDTSGTSSTMIHDINADLSGYTFLANRGLGTVGVDLSTGLESLTSLSTNTVGTLNLRLISTKKDHYLMRVRLSVLREQGISASLLEKILMDGKNVYEVGAPLTSSDVGLYSAAYSN